MAVSPAVRRYLAQLEKVSNPKTACKRVPSKYVGKKATIKRGKFKGEIRGLACSDQPKHIWGRRDTEFGRSEELDIPVSLFSQKAYHTDGRGVRGFVGGKSGIKWKDLGVEYVKAGTEGAGRGGAARSKWKKKRPTVKRFSGFGRKGTGMGPTELRRIASKQYSDVPRGNRKIGATRAAARRAEFLESERLLRASRKATGKGKRLTHQQLRELNAARTDRYATDERRKLSSRDAAGFMSLYESRAAAIVAKAAKAAKKPASQVKGAPEVSDSAVERAVANLPAAEVKQVEVLADKLVDAGMPESEVEKLGRLLLVEINKIPSKEGRQTAFRQLEKTFRTALELPVLGRRSGSKNKVKSAKVAKAEAGAMATETKKVAADNGAQSLASVSNPRRRGMPARHLIRF